MSTSSNPLDQFVAGVQALESTVDVDVKQIQTLTAQVAALQSSANAFAAEGLEQTQWLLAGGTLANTNQTGSTANAIQSVPGVGGCASLQIVPNGPWADAYWYKEFGPKNDKTHYKYEFGFMFPTAADSAAAHCVELDIEQHVGGIVFNCGVQFGFDGNTTRIWDRSKATPADPGAGNWIATGAACPRWVAGTWVKGTLTCHRDAGNVYYDSLVVNGVSIPVSQFTFASPNLGYSDKMDVAVQLDSNGAGVAFKILEYGLRFTAS